MAQPGFFDVDEWLAALSAAGDPLVRLSTVVDFELFRDVLDKALNRSDRSQGGRPPYDAVLMFKVLVLQALYSLSDDAVEFQIRDRLSLMRFLGLGLGDKVPDAKTVWLFREQLVQAKAIEPLFARFDEALHAAGYLAMGGQIIDATVVAAPRQKLNDDEKATIRGGGTPPDWSKAKHRQKDTDARWTIKRGRRKHSETSEMKAAGVEIAVPIFGYKNHAGIDRRFGFIRRWCATSAAAHDSRPFEGLLDPKNTDARVWADTAYRSKRNEAAMRKRRLISRVHFRKPKGKPLPPHHARANAARSPVRSAIEHVFAGQKHRMKLFVRTIGIARATMKIGMANLAYNFQRLAWLDARSAPG
ncbi:IS5 family transposase [Sphingobium sp. R-21]|uniref:IS5 family transposase n=1 Tax=Sphingobium sp. R-21 TaxID=3404056 RepID=UPI003CE6A213